ncbi:membrane protein [Desulfosporosinus sp. Tol-M]|nr:membrane protein [Desulfosporosinus sp. Tol-M]
MNTYRPTQSSNYWMIALKLLILILGLYISALVLNIVFTWVFAITFFLIRFVVILVVSFMVLHFFLKLLFKIDLLHFVTSKLFLK